MPKLNNRPARVAAIHDLSCFGRCSLSVILPIISVMGSQVCPLPTHILSTHTGGFNNIKSVAVKDFVSQSSNQYSACSIEFDAIYSGYLATVDQVNGILSFCNNWPDAFYCLDPVMGDGGKLYANLSSPIIETMCHLSSLASLITPNPTEACLLTSIDYKETFSKSEALSLLYKLDEKTRGDIIITGICIEDIGKCNLCLYNSQPYAVMCNYQFPSYHGTGDCFSAAVLGGLLRGDNLLSAVSLGTSFVEAVIEQTAHSLEPTRDGVFFEQCLSMLCEITKDRAIIL